jgi:putative SOS response-associated peptidase YedK
MCYHGSKAYTASEVKERYRLPSVEVLEAAHWQVVYHENGFDHAATPVLISPELAGMYSWGLIPWYTKSTADANLIRNQTLNCISEEMFDKPSFRDSLKQGQRCLIPMTGFFEWKWQDSKGKDKTPYYIFLKGQKIFSVAGIYSTWQDTATGTTVYSYSVLTTKANLLMEEIHNIKKRMPVILPPEYEKDWLNPTLTKDDVLALCQPLPESRMDAHVVSKLITSKRDPTNVPAVLTKAESGLLF